MLVKAAHVPRDPVKLPHHRRVARPVRHRHVDPARARAAGHDGGWRRPATRAAQLQADESRARAAAKALVEATAPLEMQLELQRQRTLHAVSVLFSTKQPSQLIMVVHTRATDSGIMPALSILRHRCYPPPS